MKIKIGPCWLTVMFFPGLAYLALMILLLALGHWQLSRSHEKAAMLAQQQKRLNEPVMALDLDKTEAIESLRYHPVQLKGRFDSQHQFLIDNQIRQGKPGYFVMTPLIPENSSRAVLINRGWVALNTERSVLPDVTLINDEAIIDGRINTFPGVGWKLQGAEIPSDSWPAVVQVVDTQILSERLGYPLAAFQVELAPDSGSGYLREWTLITAIPPEKHVAYALQWFGLALALTVLFFWHSCTKHE